MKLLARRLSLLVLALALLGGVPACSGDDGDLQQRCTEARASLARARVDMMGPAPSEALARDYEQHRKSYENALGPAFVESCNKRGDQFASCILDADTARATLDCARDAKAKQALRKSAPAQDRSNNR